ncbi:MAG: hypothetical protein LBN12_04850 [Clostridiales Family XIII bacterium]|jgi:hypothetical protein|nr:hypothetical protein [Clostridiales Family XIII bacterium]
MDFDRAAGSAERIKGDVSALPGKFLEIDEYVRKDIEKVTKHFGDQSAGQKLRIALEDTSQALKTASQEISHFQTGADKMIALLRQGR